MAKIATYSCDTCGIQKQPSNNWFRVFKVNGGMIVLEWDADIPSDIDVPEDGHLCGSTHVVEWMSKEFFGK